MPGTGHEEDEVEGMSGKRNVLLETLGVINIRD